MFKRYITYLNRYIHEVNLYLFTNLFGRFRSFVRFFLSFFLLINFTQRTPVFKFSVQKSARFIIFFLINKIKSLFRLTRCSTINTFKICMGMLQQLPLQHSLNKLQKALVHPFYILSSLLAYSRQ